jgi:RNA polymerase sigma-70 factor, ECF subfamily
LSLLQRSNFNRRFLDVFRGQSSEVVEDVAQELQELHDEPQVGETTGDTELELELVALPELPAFPAADPSEAALVEQARQEPAAFGQLYESYVDRIYAYIFHRVGNAQDAEDITARTFYRALDKLDTYEDRGLPFSAWLFRIAHNLVANWHRDRSRRRFLSLDRLWGHSQELDTPEHHVEQAEKNNALWSAINRLPEERRTLLLLKFGSQLSNLEIGELMDKSESAIKSLYFRTLAALRKDLEARGWGDEAAALADLVADGAPDGSGGVESSAGSHADSAGKVQVQDEENA